jgi:sialate O-acetylesterase
MPSKPNAIIRMTRKIHPYLLSAAMTAGAGAVDLPRMFSDHGFLQQGSAVSVWGWANPGENITVGFGGQKVTAKADANGEWRIGLTGLPANATGRNMTRRTS